ncbi:MAG: hypothetical protein JO034_17580 [Singulisphaera sp.]|nr:hypothetical protein [Singulisphaera sp.]
MVTDYYAMLGVDPEADRATLEAALARNQPIWSSGTRNPKNKHTYQSYLDQIPALRQALLGDPAARASYDAELATARRAGREQKLDALLRLVRLRAAKGGLTVSDRDLLHDRAVALGLTSGDLDRLIEGIPPRSGAPAEVDVPDPPADVLDPTMRRQIRVALEHLRRRDLYDALGLARDAPMAEIGDRADAERRRWMHKAQITAEKTAWLEVVSHAQTHMTAPEARARYDRTLAQESEESLGDAIEFALTGQARLDPGTHAALLDEAAGLGIAPDRAATLIGRACRALGVASEAGAAPAASAPLRFVRCRSCGGVTAYGAAPLVTKPADCRHCSASLRWGCPVCRKSRAVDEPLCTCGFRIERLEPLSRHFQAARHAFQAHDLEAALAHLRRVQEYAPEHDGARRGIERVRRRQGQIEQARAAWDVARAGAKLFAARKALSAWSKLVGAGDPEVRAAWATRACGLREAEALAAEARAREMTDPKTARGLYRQSLALAADLPEALAGLRRCPPDGPTELQAEYVTDRVQLRWSPPEPDGLGPLSFVVLRKRGGPLGHPADGNRVAEVSATEYEDTKVIAGETVSYAVLSKRGKVESITAATTTPLLLLAEVADVRVETRSHEVDLSWKTPARAHDVRVVRKREGVPIGPKDGDLVPALRDRAHDRGLQDDQVYSYGLFALYAMPDGSLAPSRGTFVSAQPTPPAAIPDAPRLAHEPGGRLRLDWPAPPRGTIKVVRTPRPLPHVAGHRLAAAEAEALEGQWLEVVAPGEAIDPDPPRLGVCYYTPLVAWAGMATVGHAATYSCIPDPCDLRATRVGTPRGRVRLRWRWSPRETQALIVARFAAPPRGPDDPEALVAIVHEAEYSRQGHATLMLPPSGGGLWHLRVFSVAAVDGERVVSAGLDPTAATVVPGPDPEVTVSYTLRRPAFPGRPWSLTFRSEPAGAAIPPTALVAHPRTVPLSTGDGEIVAQFPAARDGASFTIPTKLDLARHRARIFVDPHVAPDSLPPIRLRHPEADPSQV